MLEKDLEDAICQNPSLIDEHARIIHRQLTLAHGRLDLLAWYDFTWGGTDTTFTYLQAIELKAGRLQGKDVSQVLRYMSDLEQTIWASEAVHFPMPTAEPTPEDYLQEAIADIAYRNGFIKGLLIGAAIDAETLAAANGAGIQVLLWGHDEEGYYLYQPNPQEPDFVPCRWVPGVVELCRKAAIRHLAEAMAKEESNG